MQTVTNNLLKDTMYYQNIPVFIYNINYPSFQTTCNAAAGQKINEHYVNRAKSTEEYCRTVLYPQAVQNMRYRQSDAPVNSYTLDMVYEITFNSDCITSLYTDTYTYMGGAHGATNRTSDTWNFNTGNSLKLRDIYWFSSASLHRLYQSVTKQITERLALSPGSYFNDYSSLLIDNFNPDNFYLRPGKGVIYYQQYDIAPYSTGIPEFDFPLPPSSI